MNKNIREDYFPDFFSFSAVVWRKHGIQHFTLIFISMGWAAPDTLRKWSFKRAGCSGVKTGFTHRFYLLQWLFGLSGVVQHTGGSRSITTVAC